MPAFQVFISSIFRDMETERDALTRIVLPKIRKECEVRGVDFSYVDLRWGIDDDLLLKGRVIDHCLDQIDETSPVFFGMIGPRYGSILPYENVCDLSATHHEFRRAFLKQRELVFLVCDTEECRSARSNEPKLEQMLEETPPECREIYSTIEQFIERSERKLTEALDRLHPRGAEDNPIREAAVRQERLRSVVGGRMASLWQGDAAEVWLRYLYQVVAVVSDDTRSPSGIFPLITQTAGDAEAIAVELATFYRKHGPENDLVFDHASGAENDRSAAWIMRRLLTYLAAETDISLSSESELSDAKVQVLINIALAELAEQERHLRVILSRTDPVEMLLYLRPLLISPICAVVTVLTDDEARTLPLSIDGLTPPPYDVKVSESLLQSRAVAAGKALALKTDLVETLVASPICQTLTGTMLLGDWLVAWGDLNPVPGASQDAWLQAEVERVAKIVDLKSLSTEVLSTVSRLLSPIVSDFETLSKAFLDVLRVAPVPLTLDELQSVVQEVTELRGLSVDLRQAPLTLTYLAKAFTSIGVDAHNYRLIEPAQWAEPTDANGIGSAIVRALTVRSADRRRAEGAARCAIETASDSDRHRVLDAPGFAALIEVSLLTALAVQLEGVVAEKLEALWEEYGSDNEQSLVDDSLALITALNAHDREGCMSLAETIAQRLNANGKARSRLTSGLAAKAQTALDQGFEKDAIAWRSSAGNASNPFDTVKSAFSLHAHDPHTEPREAQDFLHNINVIGGPKIPPQLALLYIQSKLRNAVALDTLGATAAKVALEMVRHILASDLDENSKENAVLKLCAFAVKLTISSEEGQFANSSAPALAFIDKEGLQADSLYTLDDSIVAQVMQELLSQLSEARKQGQISDELFLSVIDQLVLSLAASDRRFEYSVLLRAFPSSSLHDFIKHRWSKYHRSGEREHVAETLVNAFSDLRGAVNFV